MTATYQDVAQMIRDGASAEDVDAVLADERTALTDEQIETLRDDLLVRDAEGLTDDPEGCESGEATGELCQSVLGPDAVTIEWMPEYLRESHRAAGNSGSYPSNGAIRFRSCPECAASLAQHDGEWARVVIEIPLSVSRQGRGRELTIEELRACAGPAVEYSVCRVSEIPPLDLDAMETARQFAHSRRFDTESEAVALARARALAAIDEEV